MSVPQRVRGVRILKAVSSPLRLQILNLLFDKGPMSYTELMGSLRMSPSRDAGRFAYHLKFLLKADLIEADVEAKKYLLTELGNMVIDVADRIDKKALKPKSTLVRTSRPSLEEFDANKIANSLIREAKMPAELAQKVAKEAEKQLLKSKTKYLTAPLVREVVNAILIEKGLEDYRHKLTRLGIPVHDVASFMETSRKPQSASVHELAGETVFKEYALLNIFPRDISDAHLSGALYVNGLSSWILKPREIMHDLRFFLENGLNLEKVDSLQPSFPPPRDLESALSLTLSTLLHSSREVDGSQNLEYFNVFLAPFAKGIDPSKIKNAVTSFLNNLTQHTDASIGLELSVPDFLAQKAAIGPGGRKTGIYSDFAEQAQLVLSILFDALTEATTRKPLTEPSFIVKIRPETFSDEKTKTLLLKAHNLSSGKATLYFANLLKKETEQSVFSDNGTRLNSDWDGDWEIDTLRTGCLGIVTINVPRTVNESGKDKTKFLEILKEKIEMAGRALEIKHQVLKRRSKSLLPFIMQGSNGDQYFRIDNCSRIINFAGFRETSEMFYGKDFDDEKTINFVTEVCQEISAYVNKIGRRRGRRLLSAMLPTPDASRRFAQTDIERYGIGKINFSGTRDNPYYSTIGRLTLTGEKTLLTVFETKLAELYAGGSVLAIELGETKRDPQQLMAFTKQIADDCSIGLLSYCRRLTYCLTCKETWFGLLHKCPSCGGVGTLVFFNQLTDA